MKESEQIQDVIFRLHQQLIALVLLLLATVGVIALVYLGIQSNYLVQQETAFCGVVDSFSSSNLDSLNQLHSEGSVLFANNCGACHARDMRTDLTGPALGGAMERWSEFPREDLYNWIRNSQQMVADAHPRALELWGEWKPTVMNALPLTDEEIEAILIYIGEINRS